MKTYRVEHDGELRVAWVDLYQHPMWHKIKNVRYGHIVMVVSEKEFGQLQWKNDEVRP